MALLKPLIGIVNLSTKVSNDDVKTMTIAVQDQLNKEVALEWHMEPWFVIFYEDISKLSPRAYPVIIVDNDQTPGALGYHAEANGRPYARVMCDPVLDNGGVALYDESNPQNTTISSVLSHEVIELYLDLNANEWVDGPGGETWAKEGCDAVQDNSYVRKVGKVSVSVSDFLLPAYFDPQNTDNDVDFLKILGSNSFSVAPGGYAILRTGGQGTEKQIFGKQPPKKWIMDAKKKSMVSRTSRRMTETTKKWWQYFF